MSLHLKSGTGTVLAVDEFKRLDGRERERVPDSRCKKTERMLPESANVLLLVLGLGTLRSFSQDEQRFCGGS